MQAKRILAMAMKVLLLDRDEAYASRIAQFISKKTDMQISVCNDLEIARKMAEQEHFQVILFDAEFEDADPEEFRRRNTAFAFISNINETVKDTETLHKFISVPELYGEIMRIYSEHTQHAVRTEDGGESGVRTKVLSFFPVNGGAGSSTMAMAAAISLAKDHKVLYLTLEQRHAEMLVFSSPEKLCLTDIVAMLRTNYPVKEAKQLFQLVIRNDTAHGGNLDFIPGFLTITDCLSLTPAILETLIDILRKQFSYHYIVIDADFIVDARLKDGSRVNVVLYPIALGGDTVTIRKFSKKPMSVEKLIEYKSITQDIADNLRNIFLRSICVPASRCRRRSAS